jgi:hypothetical protein
MRSGEWAPEHGGSLSSAGAVTRSITILAKRPRFCFSTCGGRSDPGKGRFRTIRTRLLFVHLGEVQTLVQVAQGGGGAVFPGRAGLRAHGERDLFEVFGRAEDGALGDGEPGADAVGFGLDFRSRSLRWKAAELNT